MELLSALILDPKINENICFFDLTIETTRTANKIDTMAETSSRKCVIYM